MGEDKAPIDEFGIVQRVLAGEKDEYRHLVRANQDQVYAMIMRQVGDPHTARDLTQEVMVRAYVSLPKFQFKCKFSTWLTRIALNLTSSYFSSKEFKRRARTTTLDAEDYEGFCRAGEASAASEQALQQLRLCVAALTPKYREVLVLCGFESKSYEEAARLLGVPVGTVCSRLNTARGLLRAKLKRSEA
jgi:RNA polymerase sigma factor (sigma-70 family)